MIATFLALTIFNSDGSVQYQSQQPRVENHYHYDTYSNQPDLRELQQQQLDRINQESDRMRDNVAAENNRQFQNELLRRLK
ncbi:MAG TPA: hypothetical protein VLE95_08935 [Chlamydiales bacterium]|nr:hypothetical protein [Chlamydiales bacterium]